MLKLFKLSHNWCLRYIVPFAEPLLCTNKLFWTISWRSLLCQGLPCKYGSISEQKVVSIIFGSNECRLQFVEILIQTAFRLKSIKRHRHLLLSRIAEKLRTYDRTSLISFSIFSRALAQFFCTEPQLPATIYVTSLCSLSGKRFSLSFSTISSHFPVITFSPLPASFSVPHAEILYS